MYKQDDKSFPDAIRKYGCYFFCLLRICELTAGVEYTVDQILTIYGKALEAGAIRAKCSCVNPDTICRMALDMVGNKKRVYQVGGLDKKMRPSFWGWANRSPFNQPQYIALTFKTNGEIGTHYVLANTMQEVIYDPSSTDYTGREKLGGLLHCVW